jgi:hypothetical protein
MISQGKTEMICNVIDQNWITIISIKEKRTVYKKNNKEYVNIRGSKIELTNKNGEYHYNIPSPKQIEVNTFNTLPFQTDQINTLSLFGTPILSKNPFNKNFIDFCLLKKYKYMWNEKRIRVINSTFIQLKININHKEIRYGSRYC